VTDTDATSPRIVAAPLRGRRVELRPPGNPDFDFLYALSTDDDVGFRWGYRGTTPSPQAFAETFWADSLAQFVVMSTTTGERHGLARLYRADIEGGHCHVAVILQSGAAGIGLGAEAGLLVVNYAFAHWSFRKLYFDVAGYNLELFASALAFEMTEEVRLRDYDFYGGRYWDRHVFSLSRSGFEKIAGSDRISLLTGRR
jgi:RimJ/RimL family protein N-acetyltransferase